MEIRGDRVIFSTGKELYANGGRIGLSPKMSVTEGYDGGFTNPANYEWLDDDDEEKLTKAELGELADFMIKQWQKFKELYSTDT